MTRLPRATGPTASLEGVGAGLPDWLGWVIGGVIFCLAGLAYGAIILYAWRESKRPDEPPGTNRKQP